MLYTLSNSSGQGVCRDSAETNGGQVHVRDGLEIETVKTSELEVAPSKTAVEYCVLQYIDVFGL